MGTDVDLLLSGNSAAGAALGLSSMFAQLDQVNAAIRQNETALNQQNNQFLLQLDEQGRQTDLANRTLNANIIQAERESASREAQSSFDRVNQVLDRQLQLAEVEGKKRDAAFDRTLRALQSDIQTRAQVAQVKWAEHQLKEAIHRDEAIGFTDMLDTKMQLLSDAGTLEARVEAVMSLKKLMTDEQFAGARKYVPREVKQLAMQQIDALSPYVETHDLRAALSGDVKNLTTGDLDALTKRINSADGFADPNELVALSHLGSGVRLKPEQGYNDLIAQLGAKYGPDSTVVSRFKSMAGTPAAKDNMVKLFQSGLLDQLSSPQLREKVLTASATIDLQTREALAGWQRSGEASDPKLMANLIEEGERRKKETLYELSGIRDKSVLRLVEGPNQLTAASAYAESIGLLKELGVVGGVGWDVTSKATRSRFGREVLGAKVAPGLFADMFSQNEALNIFSFYERAERIAAMARLAGATYSPAHVQALIALGKEADDTYGTGNHFQTTSLRPDRWLSQDMVKDGDMLPTRLKLTGETLEKGVDWTKRNGAVIYDHYLKLGTTMRATAVTAPLGAGAAAGGGNGLALPGTVEVD